MQLNKIKLCTIIMQQTIILVNMIAFYLNCRIYLTIIVQTEKVIQRRMVLDDREL
jgi:hypothetical protein